MTISTGVPVDSRFSLSYGPFNPAGAFNIDGIEVSLSIIASDVFGHNPTDGTRVTFVAPESGNIQNSCLLVNGACTVTWRSTAPRVVDGRVEVIAYTDGAEDFTDNNGNSVFDSADILSGDLGEPYADENESGAYDLGEFFFDTNQNGVRDIGNGLWDGPCLSKVDPAALCSGNDTVVIYKTVTIVMSDNTAQILSLGTFPAPGNVITLQEGTSISLTGLILSDSTSINPLPFGTTVTFALDGSGATLQGILSDTIPNTLSPTGPYGVTVVATNVEPPATLPTGVRLLLNVQVPNVALKQFAWPLNITF
jgi:hypothetical protein